MDKTNYCDNMSDLAKSLTSLGIDEHDGYVADGHHDAEAMLKACMEADGADYNAFAYGEPQQGYGIWDMTEDEEFMKLEWSKSPRTGLVPMTRAFVTSESLPTKEKEEMGS